MVGLKIGDIITAYHAGYHQVVKIEERVNKEGLEMSPLIYYKQLLTQDGKAKALQKERACDRLFCKLATEELTNKINNLIYVKQIIYLLEEEIEQAKRKDN